MKDIKILFVDEEEDFVRVIAERLQLRDLATDTAFSTRQTMNVISHCEPDVIVLDLKLTGFSGMEVLKSVRRRYPGIQVIIQTGHRNDFDEEEAQRLGVFDYLKKPVEIELLVERIRMAVQEKYSIESSMMAATFAEEGEHLMALEVLGDKFRNFRNRELMGQ